MVQENENKAGRLLERLCCCSEHRNIRRTNVTKNINCFLFEDNTERVNELKGPNVQFAQDCLIIYIVLA